MAVRQLDSNVWRLRFALKKAKYHVGSMSGASNRHALFETPADSADGAKRRETDLRGEAQTECGLSDPTSCDF